MASIGLSLSSSSSSSLFCRSLNKSAVGCGGAGFVSSQSGVNDVRCKLTEPLRFSNGRPPIPIVNGNNLPTFVTPTHPETTAGNRKDTRLRIFSGSANPSLSQFHQYQVRAKSKFWYFLRKLKKVHD